MNSKYGIWFELQGIAQRYWYAESATRFINWNIIQDMPEIQNTEYGFYYNVLQKDFDKQNLQFYLINQNNSNSKYWISKWSLKLILKFQMNSKIPCGILKL